MKHIFSSMDSGAWLRLVQTVYVWLLVLTVVATVFVNYFATKISEESDRKIAEANATSAAANQIAAGARLLVAEANERAEDAKSVAASANLKTAHLNERAKALELESARARRDLEGERIERIRLQLRLSDRHINREQARLFVERLHALRGMPVVLTALMDSEVLTFADEIHRVLVEAGFQVERSNMMPMGFSVPAGLGVSFTEDRRSQAQTIVAAIKASEISLVPVHASPMPGKGRLEIFVGPKPSPQKPETR